MLLQLFRKTLTTQLQSFNFTKLLQDLANNGYAGVLADLRQRVAELFIIPLDQAVVQTGPLYGDMFFPGAQKLFYMKCRQVQEDSEISGDVFADPGQSNFSARIAFEAGLIAPLGECDQNELDEFCEDIITILEVKHDASNLKWEEIKTKKKADKGSRSEGAMVNPPAESELELAGLLREPKLEEFLTALRAGRNQILFDEWLAGRADAEEVEYFIDKLFAVDFFEEELLVYSARTTQPVLRAKDRTSLEGLKAAGIRDVNGDEIDIENVKRLILMSPENEKRLSLAWQAHVFLTDFLFKAGVNKKALSLVEERDGLEILQTNFDGAPLVFFLSNGPLTADQMVDYSGLFEKLGKPRVVTLAKGEVDADAAVAAGADSCTVLQGIDEISTTLLNLLGAQRLKSIQDILKDFDGMFSLNVSALSLRRLSGEA